MKTMNESTRRGYFSVKIENHVNAIKVNGNQHIAREFGKFEFDANINNCKTDKLRTELNSTGTRNRLHFVRENEMVNCPLGFLCTDLLSLLSRQDNRMLETKSSQGPD